MHSKKKIFLKKRERNTTLSFLVGHKDGSPGEIEGEGN